jgi:hypothetical protein
MNIGCARTQVNQCIFGEGVDYFWSTLDSERNQTKWKFVQFVIDKN